MRGVLLPLDCVLECEEPAEAVPEMWRLLVAAGAEPSGARCDAQAAPPAPPAG